MRYLVAPNNTLLVKGPASVRLMSGTAEILGAPVPESKVVIVRAEKQIPVTAHSEVNLEVALGKSAKLNEIQGSTVPDSWQSAADTLEEIGEGRVVIIGATDVGKTSLSTFLVNRLLERGLRLNVVDADIGQADLGPPTTIGNASAEEYVTSLSELEPHHLIFIGHTSPGPVEKKLVDGVRKLAAEREPKLTIVNTDGWVAEPDAILYKIRLIESLKPDLVIALSNGSELMPILSGSRSKSLRVQTAKDVLRRSQTNRRALRATNFRRYLDGGTTHSLPQRTIELSLPQVFRTPDSRNLQNAIIGLLDKTGYLLNIGVLLELEHDRIVFYSAHSGDFIKIEVGYIKLSTDGEELGYVDN